MGGGGGGGRKEGEMTLLVRTPTFPSLLLVLSPWLQFHIYLANSDNGIQEVILACLKIRVQSFAK